MKTEKIVATVTNGCAFWTCPKCVRRMQVWLSDGNARMYFPQSVRNTLVRASGQAVVSDPTCFACKRAEQFVTAWRTRHQPAN